jgi:hypothetical protein
MLEIPEFRFLVAPERARSRCEYSRLLEVVPVEVDDVKVRRSVTEKTASSWSSEGEGSRENRGGTD